MVILVPGEIQIMRKIYNAIYTIMKSFIIFQKCNTFFTKKKERKKVELKQIKTKYK